VLVSMFLAIVFSLAVTALVLLARHGRRKKERLRQALAVCTSHLGWSRLANASEPIWYWNGRMRASPESIAGMWKGQPAEVTLFHFEQVYQLPEVSLALVRGSGSRSGFNEVIAMGTAYEQIRDFNGASADLSRRFAFTGDPRDLRTLFDADVAKALGAFPRRVQYIRVNRDVAGIVWTGWETDVAVLECALDLAQGLGRRAQTT